MTNQDEPRNIGCSCGMILHKESDGPIHALPVAPHDDLQNTECREWSRLLDLIHDARRSGVEEFRPLRGFTAEERQRIVALPPEIGGLDRVRVLDLYGTSLVRLPAEVGSMARLEEFVPCTSHRTGIAQAEPEW